MRTPDDREQRLFAEAFSALLDDAPEAPEFDDLLFTFNVPTPNPRARAARRRPWIFGVATAAVLILIGFLPALLRSGPSDDMASVPAPNLGVFQPMRGRIVVVDGRQLVGIDPTDPQAPVTLDIPDPPVVPDEACVSSAGAPCDDGANSLMPAGWSSDGTVLGLESEYSGMSYLLDESGTLTRIPWEQAGLGESGCCTFVTSNWLAPDGSHAVRLTGGGLAIVNLRDMSIESAVELDPDEFPGLEGYGQTGVPSWSPDGTEVAFVAASYEDRVWTSTIQIYDPAAKKLHQLNGPTLAVRNLAWSPDGTQLLVVAGDTSNTASQTTMDNDLAHPEAAGLYLFNIDGESSLQIASGHYVVAAWSPDGRQIAAIDYPSRHFLVAMNTDGTNQKRLIDMNGYGYDNLFTGVAWHPIP